MHPLQAHGPRVMTIPLDQGSINQSPQAGYCFVKGVFLDLSHAHLFVFDLLCLICCVATMQN